MIPNGKNKYKYNEFRGRTMKNEKFEAKKMQNKKKKEQKNAEEIALEQVQQRYEQLLKTSTATLLTFDDFPLSWRTLEGLKENDYERPTNIQRDSLPFSLSGSDVVGAAQTGSGKTLAIVIPVLEGLWRAKWCAQYGLGALVISPTRELALQTFATFNAVGKHHELSCALLIGGSDVEFEKRRIHAVNIVVCTPGRLLQHMDENELLNCDGLQILVLDEADRMLDMGFSKQINAIISNLPTARQTLLFSATQTRNVQDLCRVCSKDPVFVSVHENAAQATPENLKQSYVVCEEHEKINALWSFVAAHKKKKSLVFVSSCKQARFLTQAFCQLRPGLSVLGLWGTMNQKKRIDAFQKFDDRSAAVMIATDVASRGLDFDHVDWVIQVDCPPTADDYIHRVGRSARMNEKGEAVLFVTPFQEKKMIAKLAAQNIPIDELNIDPGMMTDIRVKLRAMLAQSQEMKDYAQKSVVAYLRAVFMMQDKQVFDANQVDAAALADSYGLVSVPRVRFLAKQNAQKAKASLLNGEKEKKPEKKRQKKQVRDEDDDDDEDEEEKQDPTEESLMGKFAMDDGDGDDFLVVKKANVFNVKPVKGAKKRVKDAKNDEEVNEDEKSDHDESLEDEMLTLEKNKLLRKPLTKQQAARKILNKKLVVNTKTTFGSDDDEAPTTSAPTTAASVGLDLDVARRELKAVDKEDRKRFREIRQKRKTDKLARKAAKRKADELDLGEGDDDEDDEGPDLDWLPDPDEVRKRYKMDPFESDEEEQTTGLEESEAQALALLQKR